MPTRLEEHDSMAAQLDEMHMDNLRTMYKQFVPGADFVGQESTLMGLKILILSNNFPEFYETSQGGGVSQVRRKQ